MTSIKKTRATDRFAASTVDSLLARALGVATKRRAAPWVIGITGAQGAGKSTLAAQLAESARAIDLEAVVISLDDFYLGRAARQRLATDSHELFATRGVPGTHDAAALLAALKTLRRGRAPLVLPRFDKGKDTRLPAARGQRVRQAPQLILLEGWCLGLKPQSDAKLRPHANALEASHDTKRVWRHAVNEALKGVYAEIFAEIDALIALIPPDFDIVARWRHQAEGARRGAPRAMNKRAIEHFVLHFERLTRHAMATLPKQADIVLRLDETRAITRAPAV